MLLPIARDGPATGSHVASAAVESFGLRVQLPPELVTHEWRAETPGDRRPPTVVSVEETPIGIWEGDPVERVREVRHDGRVIWSVDVDPDRGFQMHATGLVTMVVTHDGLAVRCAPEPDVAESGWSALVPAQALPLAATLRHLEVLHASAVTLDGRALVFCAQPGVGKSSLAAQLLLRGAGLLSDDAVALDDELVAHPSTGALHLRTAELTRLDQATRERLGIRAATRIDGRAVGTVPPAAAAPLDAVFLLERAEQGPTVELVEAVDPAILIGATFNLSVRSRERLMRHLEFCASIAAQVPVFRMRVTPGVDSGALAEAVLRCR